jgi:hypothetical protein
MKTINTKNYNNIHTIDNYIDEEESKTTFYNNSIIRY